MKENALKKLFALLSTYGPLSKKAKAFIMERVTFKEVKKGRMILLQGEKSNKMFFLTSGLVQIFTHEGNEEISTGFLIEGHTAMCVQSFFNDCLSDESIQVLEDATFLVLSREDYYYAISKFPDFTYVCLIHLQEYYSVVNARYKALRYKDPIRRIREFMRVQPYLFDRYRLTNTMIASYLCIDRHKLPKYFRAIEKEDRNKKRPPSK